jgi:hypothetical protein
MANNEVPGQMAIGMDGYIEDDPGTVALEGYIMQKERVTSLAEARQTTLQKVLSDYDVVDVVTTEPSNYGHYAAGYGAIVVANRGDGSKSYQFASQHEIAITPSLREIGFTSPSPWTSWTRQEWNPKLRDKLGLTEYYRMKRQDGIIRGALRLLKTPIQAANWSIRPASNDTRDINMAKFIEKQLFDGLNVSWSHVLSDVLLMSEYGHMTFEKVWKEDYTDTVNGHPRVVLQKLAPRHPLDIQEWIYDLEGGPDGIVMEPNPNVPYALGTREERFIPIKKLIVFSLEPEAGDMTGISVLRSAYKHYFYKDTLYKIDAVQKERHGIGIPVIKLPPNFSASDRRLADELGRNLRTNERAHVVLPPQWELEFAKIEGQPVDCMISIDHHNKQIMANILAPFMEDPRSEPESMDMFLKSVRYIASTIADCFNTYLIKEMIDMNFSRTGGKYPKLIAKRIGEWEDMRTMSFTLRNLAGARFLTPDDELEDRLREELDMPPRDPETAREIPTAGQTQIPTDEGEQDDSSGHRSAGPGTRPIGASRQGPVPPFGGPRGNAGGDRSGG